MAKTLGSIHSSHKLPSERVSVRFDFSFFIIRFDGGIKVWDPARQYFKESEGKFVDERFILPKFSLKQLSSGPNPLVINFGIGYPF
jgi:hypothetical protein